MKDLASVSRGTYKERLVVVSNRGPFTWGMSPEGVRAIRSVGGLVSALEPLMHTYGGLWVAWGGREEEDGSGKAVTLAVKDSPVPYFWKEVLLSKEQVRMYYHGMSNGTLWPLCHYLIESCVFDPEYWAAYVDVNDKFARAVLQDHQDNDWVWVHDYHLALVPWMLRREKPKLPIAFYWHIPFPQVDVFATLPWAQEVLQGLLGSDLIGFHLDTYAHNFMACVKEILKADVDFDAQEVRFHGHVTRVKSFPVGIDYEYFQRLASNQRINQEAARLKARLGTEIVVLGVDRLDYTKGIKERLLALERFLTRYPEYHGRLSMVQIAVPGRLETRAYRRLKRAVEEVVSQVNGKFGRVGWVPVYYMSRSFPREELAVYYSLADIALITPLRDGLNLVAKEYVGSRIRDDGVLVLSKFAGAAEQLTEALIVNPYDIDGLADAIYRAVNMPAEEKAVRMAALKDKVRLYDVYYWLEEFMRAFTSARGRQLPVRVISRMKPVPGARVAWSL